ncbi:DUF6286 domain-containing protein [Nocardia sp. NPDC088792]|uniref:DUF6286 domain-containing protein n=1 Tax=Nocardia sp. NPDC088792 TaxID=3364332 RepID=UPI0038291E59
MIRRPRRAVPALLVALALFAVCILTAISLIQKLTGDRQLVSYDSVATRLHDTGWTDGVVLAVGVAAIVLGLILLVLALLPGRPVAIPLADLDGTAASVTRRSMRSMLAREVNALPGIDARRVGLGRKNIRVTATSVHPAVAAAGPGPSDGPVGSEVSAPGTPGVWSAEAVAAEAVSDGAIAVPVERSAEVVVGEAVSRALGRIGVEGAALRTRVRAARKGGR